MLFRSTQENLIFLDESLEISDKINTKSEVRINETLLLKSKTFGLPSNHIMILESIFFDDSIHAMSPSQIMLDENLEFETKVIRFNPFEIEIYEKLFLSDSIGFHPPIIKLDENLKILDSIRVFDEYEIVLYEKIEFYDLGEIYDGIHLIEKITFDDKIISYNPFEPEINPGLKSVKSGFAIDEIPEFEIELYSEDDSEKLVDSRLQNATNTAIMIREDISREQNEILRNIGFEIGRAHV